MSTDQSSTALSKVLVSAPYMLPTIDRFRPIVKPHGIELVGASVEERLSEEELIPLLQGMSGVICGDDAFTARVLDLAPELKVISKWGTGVDSIDLDAAEARGVKVCWTPDAFTEPVADTVFAFILSFSRQLPWADQDIRNGTWSKRPGKALHECTMGIVGVGNIGAAVARRARAFGMEILGTDIRPIPDHIVDETGLKVVSHEELFRQADFVVLCCDLNPTSFHLVDSEALSLMKETAVVVNTARGPVVDESALVQALRDGGIRGAGLDVFEVEPLPLDSGLRSCESCLFSPHNANSSPSAWDRVHRSTLDQLVQVLRPDVKLDWE